MNVSDYDVLRQQFIKLMSEYGEVHKRVKKQKDWKNSFRNIIRKDIPDNLKACANIKEPYIVEGSYGKGLWTKVPWIAVFDKRITTSAQKGVYIVYLLNEESKELYLTFEIAATEAMETKVDAKGHVVFTGVVGSNDPQMEERLREKTNWIRSVIPNKYFCSDRLIDTGSKGYDLGSVYYKKYTLSDLPDGETIVGDLNKMLLMYKTYYSKCIEHKDNYEVLPNELDDNTNSESLSEENTGLLDFNYAPIEVIEHIKNFIFARGFTYTDNLIENFYLSMKSKPFVILAGTSGTGKTRLVKLFAEAINVNSNDNYKMVPVRPDWSDSSDLFGHVDLNGNYVPGEVLEFIAKAQKDPNRPYILCLDEMNLARVEYYLSDFLSVIETREVQDGKVVSDPLVTLEKYGTDTAAREKYGEIRFPQNLYLVGTVNMDETTFPFSKKVLDRANTIEFDYVDLSGIQNTGEQSVEPITAPNSFLETKYLFLKQCMDEPEFVEEICTELQKINKVLQKANSHVGYRVRDEIVFYMLNNKEAELLTRDEAMDNEIMQKILPRIQGSSISVKDMLCDLFHELAGDYEGYQTKSGNVAAKMTDKLDKSADKVRYPKSARKVAFMVRRFEEDGFTSYWL